LFTNGAGYTTRFDHDAALDDIGSFSADWTLNEIQPILTFSDPAPENYISFQAPPSEAVEASASSEGGAISIETIIASKELNPDVEPGRQTPSEVIAQQTAPLPKPSQSWAEAPMAVDRSVSGEWARGVVFETAGGEPANDFRPLIRGARPASSESRPRDNDLSASQQRIKLAGEISASEAAYQSDSNATKLASQDRSLASQSGLSRSSQLDPNAAAQAADASQTLAAEAGSVAAPLANSARDEALEQLVEGDAATADWLDRYSGRAVNASPVLLVLALERVTARKLRRTSMQFPANVRRLARKIV
jgi:hypothetical protein